MARLLVKRIAFAIPMLFVVSFFSFVLVSLSPTDPAEAVLGPFATPEQIAEKREELNLNKPLVVQYQRWLTRAVRGDLGTGIGGGGPVTAQLNARLPATVSLILAAMTLVLIGGVGLGVLSAVRGGVFGRLVGLLSVAGLAFPGFWVALLLTTMFSVKLRLFPSFGYVYLTDNPWQWLRSLVLPAIAVSLGGIATLAKQTRAAMLDSFSKDFVRVMQANGLSSRSVVYRHALRNAAIPVVTVLGVVSVSLLGAAVVVENVFGYPGIGSLAAAATGTRDLPIVQGAVVYFTLIVIAVGILVDASYSLLDPRVRIR